MISSRFSATLLAAVLFLLPHRAHAELKVGYVETQRVLAEVEEAKAAKARVQKWAEEQQRMIDRDQEALRKEKEVLDKQMRSMNDEARNQKAADIQRRVVELVQRNERYRAELAVKERKELDPVYSKMATIISQVATKEGIGMVFDKLDSGLLFSVAEYDLTNQVIRAFANK